MLEALGINSTTETVYRALLEHPGAGVVQLAGCLGIAEVDVREALDRLSELSLVRPSASGRGQLHAVSPHLGMDMILARQQAELAERQQRIEESRAVALRLISEYAPRNPDGAGSDVENLQGIDVIRDFLRAMNADVARELLAFAPGGPQAPENMDSSRPLNEELLERGVQMRTIYLDSIRNDRPTLEYATWLTSIGAQVRTVPVLPNRMIIFDRSVAVVAVDSENTASGAVALRSPGIITALCALFDTYWLTADPYTPGRGSEETADASGDREGETALSRQEAEALQLLARGYTDETIAKRLGVSPRTARRIANRLMALLGARSRFQAGVHAVRDKFISS